MTKQRTYNSEKDVKKHIKEILNYYGWFWWMPPANGMGTTGISDFCCVHNGCFIAIEAKFDKNKATPLQVSFLNSIRQEEGFAFVVNEKNIEWLEAYLGAFDRSTQAVSAKKEVSHEDGATMLNAIKELTNGLYKDEADDNAASSGHDVSNGRKV